MTLLRVWVPQLSGTWKLATAAADPAEDPPGVRFGPCVLAVSRPEFKTVNSVVVALSTTLLQNDFNRNVDEHTDC